MKNYEVNSVSVTLHHGKVHLTEDQANARRHALKTVSRKAGIYELRGPTSFKRREIFGYDGAINKALMLEVDPTQEKPKAASKARTEPVRRSAPTKKSGSSRKKVKTTVATTPEPTLEPTPEPTK